MKPIKKMILLIIAACLILACGEAETPFLQILWSGSIFIIMMTCVLILNHIEKKEEQK